MMHRFALNVVIAAAALAPSGCALVTHVLPGDQRNHYKFRPSFTVGDPQFRRSLESVGSVMVGGNSAELLENGDGIFPAILKDMREATVSIDFEAYVYKPDAVGKLFADAMIEDPQLLTRAIRSSDGSPK